MTDIPGALHLVINFPWNGRARSTNETVPGTVPCVPEVDDTIEFVYGGQILRAEVAARLWVFGGKSRMVVLQTTHARALGAAEKA